MTSYSRARLIASVSKHRFACLPSNYSVMIHYSDCSTTVIYDTHFLNNDNTTKTNTNTKGRAREGLCPLTSQSGEKSEIGGSICGPPCCMCSSQKRVALPPALPLDCLVRIAHLTHAIELETTRNTTNSEKFVPFPATNPLLLLLCCVIL